MATPAYLNESLSFKERAKFNACQTPTYRGPACLICATVPRRPWGNFSGTASSPSSLS